MPVNFDAEVCHTVLQRPAEFEALGQRDRRGLRLKARAICKPWTSEPNRAARNVHSSARIPLSATDYRVRRLRNVQ